MFPLWNAVGLEQRPIYSAINLYQQKIYKMQQSLSLLVCNNISSTNHVGNCTLKPVPDMPKSKMARLRVMSSGGFNLVLRLMVI